ncbi:hypothetical protein D9613_007312 [Agrocybe pediades]|uniref:Uncharacterized protein n=1 Tax=Agrocybe pediades TaxID=84607 RepID=A0A8H4VIE4_9AGAR|nr:hypothetical protein D9613_007312 [Agrocybe pediades]KAF9551402.1 hypothetical protein CPC08DRAFT_715089 [Agrocybe pediades]
MEVISVAATVISICKAIKTWVDQLEQRDVIIREISSLVVQIHDILEPFTNLNLEFDQAGELQLSQSIRSIGDVLEKTREHMIVWKYKKSQKLLAFLKPATLIQRLQDDEKQLSRQLLILLTSFAVVGYFKNLSEGQKSSTGLPKDVQLSVELAEAGSATSTLVPDLGPFMDDDAAKFWRDFVGLKVAFVSYDLFLARLRTWYGKPLSDVSTSHIIMCLDEFNIGGVTPDNLSRALNKENLQRFVDRYVDIGERRLLEAPAAAPNAMREWRIPLLIWIDDCPENNEWEVDTARGMGIQVIQLTSTALAKAWIEDNEAFLRENDDGSRIRFITDNARMEFTPTKGSFMNFTAGKNFLQYLRGHLYKAPVLVYTGSSINYTQYVEQYESAGSTCVAHTCIGYITNLANRRNADTEWRGFKKLVLWS